MHAMMALQSSPNFLRTAQVLSSLPLSMKSTCRNRKPSRVSPASSTALGSLAWAT